MTYLERRSRITVSIVTKASLSSRCLCFSPFVSCNFID